jgi:hypothetical protein
MTTDHDPRTRIVLSWLREDAYENPEHILLRALDEVDATPQRRSWWPAWRSDRMNTYAKLIAAAAAVLVVAVVGYQFLPRSGGTGGQPTSSPSPSPSLLARGDFTSHGVTAQLDATGSGADVAGSMTLFESDTGLRATVDLECARTTEGGLLEIGGLVTESTFDDGFPEGHRLAIILQRSSPVEAVWWIALVEEAPVSTCQELVAGLDPEDPELLAGLEPIEGNVELGP